MSLVAYDSSGESSEDEGSNCDTNKTVESTNEIATEQTSEKLCLPAPKYKTDISKTDEDNSKSEVVTEEESLDKIHFDKLPKPKSVSSSEGNDVIEEEDDDIPPRKEAELQSEKPVKGGRAPVKISVPSLSEFKDVEEESKKKSDKFIVPSKGTKLFALLPPPKGSEMKKSNILIPHVLNKTLNKTNDTNAKHVKPSYKKESNSGKITPVKATKKSVNLLNYDSNSEEEDEADTNTNRSTANDFFALTTSESVSDIDVPTSFNDIQLKTKIGSFDAAVKSNLDSSQSISLSDNSNIIMEKSDLSSCQKTLISNVMNLPKEEILLKNQAEVGPKLPIPEQEYHVDTEGNVAFDEKAIEYLCGKRGIKRKNKEIDEANIIEINGEDIKPDEREWLVKALTEEPVQRPLSMQGSGVNSQSKKKHQITYLAHQAKAMELELKNQWAQNKMTRKQTQSKYGF